MPQWVRPRSDLGHSQPNWAVHATSSLPPIATKLRTFWMAASCPISDITHPRSKIGPARKHCWALHHLLTFLFRYSSFELQGSIAVARF